MAARQYRSTVEAKTLSAGINSSVTSMTLNSVTTLPSTYPYTLVVDPDTAGEEIVTVTANAGGSVLTITRGQDGTSAQEHDAGAVVKHMITARDLQEPQDHIAATAGVHGVTGSIAPLASPAFTGTVTGITKSMVGLGSVDNTSDASKPVSTATQTALNLKAPIASPTFTGTVTLPVAGSGLVPVGTIVMYGSATAPSGWLLCNGQSTTGYTALAAVVGSTVPDLMGRVPVGYGSGAGLTARTTMKQEFGSESTTLTSSHIPQHSHTINHGHANNFNSVSAGGHSHDIVMHYSGEGSHDHAISGISDPLPSMRSDGSGGDITNNADTSIIAVGNHDHELTGDVTNHTGSSGNYGTLSPTAVTAVQPSTVVNFIIKY